jgi:hypothetical protein
MRGGFTSSSGRKSRPISDSFETKKDILLKNVNGSNAINKSAYFYCMIKKLMETKTGPLVFGIIANSMYSVLNNSKENLPYVLKESSLKTATTPLSDLTKTITQSYHLLTNDAFSFSDLFIIDKKGIIQYYKINNLLCGRSINELLRILQSIQYVKENTGQACPVD